MSGPYRAKGMSPMVSPGLHNVANFQSILTLQALHFLQNSVRCNTVAQASVNIAYCMLHNRFLQ